MSRNTAETQISFWQVNNFRSVEVHHEHKAGWQMWVDNWQSAHDSYISRQANKKEETKEERSVFCLGGGVAFMCANMEALILNKVWLINEKIWEQLFQSEREELKGLCICCTWMIFMYSIT